MHRGPRYSLITRDVAFAALVKVKFGTLYLYYVVLTIKFVIYLFIKINKKNYVTLAIKLSI